MGMRSDLLCLLERHMMREYFVSVLMFLLLEGIAVTL